jgi:gluconolactonase
MSRAEVVTGGLKVPEGPVVHGDAHVTFTEQTRGQVSRWADGRVELLAYTGGAPNSHAAGSDDCFYVAQNGGVVGDWRSPDPRTPGIQRITSDGTVEHVTTSAAGEILLAPNDLVFGADGWLYATDPAHPFDPVHRGHPGRLFRLEPGPASPAGETVIDAGPAYCNGLAFDPDGKLWWVESYDRFVCRLDGASRTQICQLPDGHIPDGFAFAVDGRMFIATCGSHGITVVAPDGEVLDLIHFDDSAVPTNCAFAPDGALWVTDFGVDWASGAAVGRLWRVETDAVGLAVASGSLGPAA